VNRRVCAIFDECLRRGGCAGVRDAALVSVLFGANVPVTAAVELDRGAWDRRTGVLTAAEAPRRGWVDPEPAGPRRRAVAGAREVLEAWDGHRGTAPGPWLPTLSRGEPDLSERLTPGRVRRALEARAAQAGVDAWSAVDFLVLYRSPWWEGA
jgi:hypothetical protein